MMKPEEEEIEILLQLLKGDAKHAVPLAEHHTERLIDLAKRHRVMYSLLLFAQLHAGVFTSEQVAQLENHCRKGAQRSLSQLGELKRVAVALTENGIDYVSVKGPQLSRMIYGRQAQKESVDLDILLVHGDDLSKVVTILHDLGFTRSNLHHHTGRLTRKLFLMAKREVHFFNPVSKCAIDLHIRPGANTYLTAEYFKGLLDHLKMDDMDGMSIPVLPDEAYFVYLCYHGSLHQFSRLAWLMDIRAFLALKRDDFDYKKLMDTARTLNCERSVLLAVLLLHQYFQDEIPPGIGVHLKNSKRLPFLARMCKKLLNREANFGMTYRARVNKLVYIMLLIKGFSGKADWFFGIGMRQVVKLLPGK